MRSIRLRRPVALSTLGVVLVALSFVGGASPARSAPAESIVDVGWWWKMQTGTLTDLPAPPNVAPGQVQVQGAVDGPIAVAALRATLPAGTAAPLLTLTVAQSGDQGGALAVILACKAALGWSGAEAGRWTSRPGSDCAGGSAVGTRSADGATWTFALAPLVTADSVDLVLVPGRLEGAPAGADGSTFTQIFEAPTVASFETDGQGSTTPLPGIALPEVDIPDTGSLDTGFAPPPLEGTFSAPPLDGGGLSLDPVVPGVPAVVPVENTGGGGALAVAPIGAELPGPSAAARAAGLAILVVGGLWTLWAWTRQPGAGLLPVPGAVALGQVVPRPGGIGRFTRDRTTAPAGLR